MANVISLRSREVVREHRPPRPRAPRRRPVVRLAPQLPYEVVHMILREATEAFPISSAAPERSVNRRRNLLRCAAIQNHAWNAAAGRLLREIMMVGPRADLRALAVATLLNGSRCDVRILVFRPGDHADPIMASILLQALFAQCKELQSVYLYAIEAPSSASPTIWRLPASATSCTLIGWSVSAFHRLRIPHVHQLNCRSFVATRIRPAGPVAPLTQLRALELCDICDEARRTALLRACHTSLELLAMSPGSFEDMPRGELDDVGAFPRLKSLALDSFPWSAYEDMESVGPTDFVQLSQLRLGYDTSGDARLGVSSCGDALRQWVGPDELADYGIVEESWMHLPALRELEIVPGVEWADDTTALSFDYEQFNDPLGDADLFDHAVSFAHYHREVDRSLRDICNARNITLRVRRPPARRV